MKKIAYKGKNIRAEQKKYTHTQKKPARKRTKMVITLISQLVKSLRIIKKHKSPF